MSSLRSLQTLRATWMSRGVDVGTAAAAVQVAEFEAAHAVRLPELMREYFLRFNGMSAFPRDSDQNNFRFLSLAEMHETRERYAAIAGLEEQEWILVDYLQGCWWYAIKLHADGSEQTAVRLVGTRKDGVIAGSFAEFLAMYEADSRLLYPERH